ncbi:hypothetical protein BV898_20137, partial [Hypsibius exemplaris]
LENTGNVAATDTNRGRKDLHDAFNRLLALKRQALFISLSALCAGLTICGVFSSIFILATVRYSKLLTASSVLIGNLCLCTLIYTLFVLPVHIMTFLARSSVVGDSSGLCQAVSFLHVTLNMASANAHVVIALHRFLMMRASAKYTFFRSRRFAYGLAVTSWIPSILTNVFPLFGMGARHGFDRKLFRCTFGPPANRSYALYSRLTLGVVPLLIMVAFYAAIYCMLRRSKRRLDTIVQRQPASLRSARRDYQATRICCIACLGFFVFYLPNAVYGLLSHYGVVGSPAASLICNQMQIIGLATNPLLYALFSTDLRMSMLICLRRCRLPGDFIKTGDSSTVKSNSQTAGLSMTRTGARRSRRAEQVASAVLEIRVTPC